MTNPIQLQKDLLISEDEQRNLADLDNKMREQLGSGACPKAVAHPEDLLIANGRFGPKM
jgi:hypothetical protein